MSEATFTVRVEDQLKLAFTEAAKVNDRTGAQLIREFMRTYVQKAREKAEYEEWFRAKVEAGRQAVQNGNVFTQDEMKAEAAARRTLLLERIGR